MTLDQLQRAQLLMFAHQEAAYTGSLAAMKAVCYVVRNRVRKGWFDGNWIEVIENAEDAAGNMAPTPGKLDVFSRTFQMLMQAVDDIYYSSASDEVEKIVGEALYYQFVDRNLRPWFTDAILRDPANHARIAHIGTMVLFN